MSSVGGNQRKFAEDKSQTSNWTTAPQLIFPLSLVPTQTFFPPAHILLLAGEWRGGQGCSRFPLTAASPPLEEVANKKNMVAAAAILLCGQHVSLCISAVELGVG